MRNGEGDKEMEMGTVVVEKVGGRSSVIRCFSRYPLKFIIPKKVLTNLIYLFIFVMFLLFLNALARMLVLWSDYWLKKILTWHAKNVYFTDCLGGFFQN